MPFQLLNPICCIESTCKICIHSDSKQESNRNGLEVRIEQRFISTETLRPGAKIAHGHHSKRHLPKSFGAVRDTYSSVKKIDLLSLTSRDEILMSSSK